MRQGVVADESFLPHRCGLRIAADAELSDVSREHAEKSRVVIESVLHEVMESVHSQRSPRAVCFDYEWTSTRLEANAKYFRRRLRGTRRVDRRRAIAGWTARAGFKCRER